MDLQRFAITEKLRFHPRVAQQELPFDVAGRDKLADATPLIVPFGGRELRQLVALIDWDHRLPSRRFVLRLHAFYTDEAMGEFEKAYQARIEEIRLADVYPEFDVPDLAELPGDESYEGDVSLDHTVDGMRLVSPWRRNLETEVAERAAEVTRASAEYRTVSLRDTARAANLGDLEAVGWTPPCESSHPRWTVDVWWLTSFDGRFGRGWSFLVDLDSLVPTVVAQREFSVRTG